MSHAEPVPIEEIYTSDKTAVFRAKKWHSCNFKTLRSEYPDPSELSNLSLSMKFLKTFSPRIIKSFGIEKYKTGLAIILEDIGRIDLYKFFTFKAD